ncbi:NAD(P)H-binding protein [Nocardiopsis sp. N85]|uniref:NAD(P)H-binding protein n=1 Tax=Nocardiopsis sp. N85 TaxID=3029400 RepID=UPI00237F2948|nr:NAD(P)H-binding protein [Nocardiopsis sp. N85]MDE3722247.1 NAD(P)H-binding protein [Nocardiopsis sp. N85]
MTNTEPILVIGGTGTTGRRVAHLLREAGHTVRAASRTAPHRFDWTDPATWNAALDGVRTAYVVPNDADPRTPDLVAAARDRGLERLVLLSARGADVPDYYSDRPNTDNGHLRGEKALADSDLEWTVVRPTWFTQNFTEGFFAPLVTAGDLRLPVHDAACPYVDTDDIAEVAVAALTRDGHQGRTYELSGPRPLTLDEVAAAFTAAGTPLTHTPVTVEEFVAERVADGIPEEVALIWADVLGPLARGRESHLSTGVEEVLGRPPRTLTETLTRRG